MKCAQTGEFKKVKIAALLKPNLIPISKNDFNERADLLLSDHGKEYPVQFVSFCGMTFGAYMHCIILYYFIQKKGRVQNPHLPMLWNLLLQQRIRCYM